MGIISNVLEFFGRLVPSMEEKSSVGQCKVVPTSATKKVAEDPEPSFVFPETVLLYRAEKARLEEELSLLEAIRAKKWVEYRRLCDAVVTTAQAEISQRKNADIILGEHDASNKRIKSIKNELFFLPFAVKRKELTEKYLLNKTEVFRSPWKQGESRGMGDSHDACRVVVNLQEKFFLLQVRRDAVMVPTGRRVGHPPYIYGEMKRTGEFLPEYVEWATSSLAQFNMEELEAVKAFQQK